MSQLDAAVLIPLRSLHDGKLRLAEAFDAEARAQLIQDMAERVLRAAHDLDALVVFDDAGVEAWAAERGARAVRPPTPGLNEAVGFGADHLRELGYRRAIVAHADLPLANDLRVLLTDAAVAIVPDRHGDGTNVMCVDLDLDFTFAYGPHSFANHMQIARNLGIEPRIIHAPDLAWDVDYPDDLPDNP